MNEDTRNLLEKECDRISRQYKNELNSNFMQSYLHKESMRPRPDGPFQRDYARIMYSSSFRRLQGKMQLLGIKNDQFFRNRLTHSLEVAQIARSIAGTLRYDLSESYVVEAGALAHDLGNPPFGHAGERKLHDIFHNIGGFEGNAQTLRILTSIERKRPDFVGLNLTYRTMLSIVKYFKKHDKLCEQKYQKFIYDEDYDLLDKVIIENELAIRTLDVQIVDIADEIAYAAHDLEDGLRVKAFTIDEILHEYMTDYGKSDCYLTLEETVNTARGKSGFGVAQGMGSTQYSKLFRQELSSRLINIALQDLDMIELTEEQKEKTGTKQTEEIGFKQYGELIHGLKKIVFKCINHNDEVYHYEKEGERVLEYLAEVYKNDKMYLPPEYRATELLRQYPAMTGVKDEDLQERLICDYIAGMMDSFAISTYEKFSGQKFMKGNIGKI